MYSEADVVALARRAYQHGQAAFDIEEDRAALSETEPIHQVLRDTELVGSPVPSAGSWQLVLGAGFAALYRRSRSVYVRPRPCHG